MSVPGGNITISRSWRAEVGLLVAYVVLSLVNVAIGEYFPATILHGQLFSIGDTTYYLHLPLFSLVTAGVLITLLWRVYNVRFILDQRGVEMRLGILALEQRIGRIRFEDIRSLDTYQSIIGRMLDFGDVFIGTAGTEGLEIEMRGIAHPYEVQSLIQLERDQRQKLAARRGKDEELMKVAGE